MMELHNRRYCDLFPGLLMITLLVSGTQSSIVDSHQIANWHPHDAPIFALAFHPDGHLVASAGQAGTIVVADSRTGGMVRTFWHRLTNPGLVLRGAHGADAKLLQQLKVRGAQLDPNQERQIADVGGQPGEEGDDG